MEVITNNLKPHPMGLTYIKIIWNGLVVYHVGVGNVDLRSASLLINYLRYDAPNVITYMSAQSYDNRLDFTIDGVTMPFIEWGNI